MLTTDIHVRSFTGVGLKPYLHSMAKLRMEVFREYPYFEEPDLERETAYLRKIIASKETIAVLIFDNTTLVGCSLGLPLLIAEDEVKRPFLEKNIDMSTYFFFGDSVLLERYRGRGMGHHFFDAREAHVKNHKKYDHTCFCVPQVPIEDPLRPVDYIPLNDFWRKRGYVHHPEMKAIFLWKDLNNALPIQKCMTFWIKAV